MGRHQKQKNNFIITHGHGGEREPKIRKRSDMAIAMAKAELQKFWISPIKENIDTYFLYKETPQRPRGYDDIYDNLYNPERLKEKMQKKNLNVIIHIEGRDLRSHIALALKILEKINLPEKEKEFLKLVIFYHDLGKQEVFSTKENRIQTIQTIAKGRLFQTMALHATAAGDKIEKWLKANGLEEDDVKFAQKLIENHMNTSILEWKDPTKIVRYFTSLGKNKEEVAETIKRLAQVLHIDYLATENVFLRNGEIEYSKNIKRSDYNFDAVRDKYQSAIQPAEKIERENKIYVERINNCEKDLLQIANHLIPLTAENNEFGNNPDDPQEHSPQRHEFGIITHSKKSIVHFSRRNQYIKDKNIKEKIDSKLQETIDGKTKLELLATAFEFHDIGKFLRAMPTSEAQKIGVDPFPGHEKIWEDLAVHDETVQKIINENYHLTPDQLKYVARCIGLHYEFAKVRDAAKKTPWGYNLKFVQSPECEKIFETIKNSNPDYAIEVWLLFLCDSLAKTDITIYGKDDEELTSKFAWVAEKLYEKKLPPELINTVIQKPVSTTLAKKYLEYILW